jgi:hypothetical protein
LAGGNLQGLAQRRVVFGVCIQVQVQVQVQLCRA